MNQNGISPLVSSIAMIDEWSLGQTTMLKVTKKVSVTILSIV